MLTRRDDGYEIDTAPGRLDVTQVHTWLATDAYWASGRPVEVMLRAVRNSLCFGLYDPDGQQVGFTRAVTDLATFAWICDVYVDRAVRGNGLGTWLTNTATEHLLGHGLRRVVLATADAHGVYAKAGFVPLSRPDWWLEIFREQVDVSTDPAGEVPHT
jgi:GNAT superfamily N-acetyltransferase